MASHRIDRTRVLIAAFVLGLGGCVDADADGTGEPTGTGSATGAEEPDCTPNDGDGRTACSGEECVAGEWCQQIICEPGCESTLNCGEGEWCDLRMPQESFGSQIGVCRSANEPVCGGGPSTAGPDSTAGADTTADTTAGSGESSGGEEVGGSPCSNVQGNYRLTLDSGGPAICDELLSSGDQCSVAQDGCELTWGCESAFGMVLTPGPINAADVYEVDGTYSGADYRCEIEFRFGSGWRLTWSCSITLGGQTSVCEGRGF